MQYLHAHWRINYVKISKGGRKSPFLRALRAKNRREALLLYKGPCSFALLNRYPYNPGHMLALPFREVEQLHELSEEERTDLWRTIFLCEEVLRSVMDPQGFNIGFNLGSAAGAGIPKHLHCHVVPRWERDTNFMPVIGAMKVIPQALLSLYDQLLPCFKEREGKE
ncbi:MAG: HIT domain-containing protein [Puniceicoccales bacterium]|jgi:ATP adenylyltransferase|nr:HIT domain-containing protein [Puniceicoccales bacterium]